MCAGKPQNPPRSREGEGKATVMIIVVVLLVAPIGFDNIIIVYGNEIRIVVERVYPPYAVCIKLAIYFKVRRKIGIKLKRIVRGKSWIEAELCWRRG